MKKKELLIINFVFGNEYQGYIPIFLFSLYKHYPDYDALIYVDRKLDKKVEKLLALIPGYKEKYKVVYVNKIAKTLSPEQMMSYRWLLYDPAFEQYKYLYIGDIDIYICKEIIPLHEQHIRHMNSKKLVYSNIVRHYDSPPKVINKFESILKKLYLYDLIVEIYYSFFYHKRMSGLHFVETDTYYRAIKKQRERFFKVYYDTDIVSKWYNLKMKLYSNEALLYYIIKKSHLGIPGRQINNFRSHHGIHFGMWRAGRADSCYTKYLQTQIFQDYYSQFKDELVHDTVLKEIIENSPVKIKRIIETMVSDLDKR